jgi:hypothetical protein
MPKIITSILFASIAIGCAHAARVAVLDARDGDPVYRVECTGDDAGDCIDAAKSTCPGGPRTVRTQRGSRSGTPLFSLDFDCAEPGATVDEDERPKRSDWTTPEATVASDNPTPAPAPTGPRRSGPSFGAALAGALNGAARGFNGGDRYAAPTRDRGCSSDSACAPGFMCSKPSGSVVGQCLRAVDSNGTPTYERDPSNHAGAGEVTCTALSCPVGFRCDRGRCVK